MRRTGMRWRFPTPGRAVTASPSPRAMDIFAARATPVRRQTVSLREAAGAETQSSCNGRPVSWITFPDCVSSEQSVEMP